MAIPRFNDDVNVIQKLADRPNDTNGLSAAALKAKFDESSGDIKDFINNTLIPFLESLSAAADIGVDDSVLSMGVSTVQQALEAIQASIVSVSVPDGGITTAKLASNAVTAEKLGSDVDYAAVGLTADQVVPIYVQADDPEVGDPDGIYLVTGS